MPLLHPAALVLNRVRAGWGDPPRALRFALVGLLGFAVDMAVFAGLLRMGLPATWAYGAGFLVATVCNYAVNGRYTFADRAADGQLWQRLAAYVAVCILALVLREAVFSALHDAGAVALPVAALAGVIVGALVSYLGIAGFVFPARDSRFVESTSAWGRLALAVAGYSVLLRAVYGATIELTPQEAYYWLYGQHLALGYLDHPPMIAWLIRAGTTLFGNHEGAVRIFPQLCWLVSAACLYALARRAYGRSAGAVAVLLLATLPGFFDFGFGATPDAPLLAAWAGALLGCYRALVQNQSRGWYIAGLALGLGMLSKYSIGLLGLPILAWLVLDPPSRHWLRRPQPYLAALLALALCTPVLVWNAQHQWVSFWFQSVRRLNEHDGAHPLQFLSILLGLLTPVGLVGVAAALWRGGFTRPQARFAWLFTVLPLMVFAAYSLQASTKYNWTGPVWLGAMPALAGAIAAWRPGAGWLLGQPLWRATALGCLVVVGSMLALVQEGIVPDTTMLSPVAWSEMVRQVETIECEVAKETGHQPLVVGMNKFFISSENAFYDPDGDGIPETSGRQLVGLDSLMWEQWAPAPAARGRDVLLVSFSVNSLQEPAVASQFSRLGPVQRREVFRHEHLAAVFYYRVGYQHG